MLSSVSDIQKRVQSSLQGSLSKDECFSVSLASSMHRDREALLEMLLNKTQFEKALSHVDSIAIRESEWSSVFCSSYSQRQNATTSDILNDSSFKRVTEKIQDSLKCSLSESRCSQRWKSPILRLACYVSMHSPNAESRVESVLSGLVRADSRRFEDVRSEIEDESSDILLLTKCIIALSKAVCTI